MAAELTDAGAPGAPTVEPGERVPEAGAGRSPLADRLRRLPDWLLAVAVAVVGAVLAVIPQWRGTFFYYSGDGNEQYAPLWYVLGHQLRAGHWPAMDPAGWLGGNYAAEGIDAIWNPVSLANDLLVSTFGDLSKAAFVVGVESLALLAAGAFLLARAYGAGRVPAVVVGTATPFIGFTLFYEASGWPMGLMAFTWTTHFWWSARRLSRGRLNPLVPFLFGGLAMTTGNPYAALGLLVVLLALAVELALAREFRRLAHLVVMGGCVGAVALLVYLPLLGIGDVTNRQTLAGLSNDTFLVPRIADLLASSSVSYLPAITNWTGALLERVPSTYLAWFVVPLMPWLRWRAGLSRLGRSAVSLWIVAGTYLVAGLGPSNLWLFRWPVRVLEYLYLAVLVIFAVVLSAGLATDRPRRRGVLSGVLLLGGGYLAWAVRPSGLSVVHAGCVLLVAALVALAVWGWSRRGMVALGAVAVVGTACVVVVQTSAFPALVPVVSVATGPVAGYPGHDLAMMRSGSAVYRGTVLQLAMLQGVPTEQLQSGRILFGNLPRATGTDSVVSYSGMGFQRFEQTLCTDYRGAFCPQAFDRLWAPAGPTVSAPLVDVMRVSTLVVQRTLRPDVADLQPPAGWHVALRDDARTVWVRDRPLEGPGRVSWASPGVVLARDVSSPERESVRYRADASGRVLFARLAWPGYSATVDGRPVAVHEGPAGLLGVDVPAGGHTMVVTYRAPGLRTGQVAVALACAVALVQGAVWAWGTRRRRLRDVAG